MENKKIEELDSLFELGKRYYEGYEVDKDFQKAKEYFEILVDSDVNNDLVYYYLGELYLNPQFMTVNKDKANLYYSKIERDILNLIICHLLATGKDRKIKVETIIEISFLNFDEFKKIIETSSSNYPNQKEQYFIPLLYLSYVKYSRMSYALRRKLINYSKKQKKLNLKDVTYENVNEFTSQIIDSIIV